MSCEEEWADNDSDSPTQSKVRSDAWRYAGWQDSPYSYTLVPFAPRRAPCRSGDPTVNV